ncbi:unnamed protein product [Rotaria sordida]|uniref:Uncharacterized protein n=1 Tax=Rotaria sordida TaxID=392033 RepID=A0A814DM79_9BILA|nr:unnamed protein product [Rotaria sordida]
MLSSLLAEYIIQFDNDQSNKSSDFYMLAPKLYFEKTILTSDVLRDKCLKDLYDILRSHIKPLWNSSIIDEQFINSEASIQFIQAAKPYDSNSSLLITVLNSLLTNYQDTSLSIELLKEICFTNFIATQADNAAAKTMRTFIIDMTRLDPHIIRTYIDQTTDLLTSEYIKIVSANFDSVLSSYHIRVAALTAFCSVIEKLLLSDDLDDGQRKMRDNLLQILREHVSDFLFRQYIETFELDLYRLRVSTCAVRKDAVTLIMHMLLNNPYFVIDSTRAPFEERQTDAETKLDELCTELEKLNKNNHEEKKIEKEKLQFDDDEDKSINDENEIKVNNNQDGLRFMDLIEQANRHVVYLFNSFTLTDCKQVVDFLANLRHYRLVLPNIEQSLRLMKKITTEPITDALWKFYKASSDDNIGVIAGKILSFVVGNEVSSKLNHITDLIQAKEKNRRFVYISCLLLQLLATPKKAFHDLPDRQWTPMMESVFDIILN